MLSSLSGRLATMFTAMFVVIGALLVGVSQHMPELRQLIALGAELLAAAIAFALLAALLMFNLLTRRLHLLALEIDAFRDSRFTRPRRLGWARADGDEIDRLAFAFGDLSDRISRQIAELERHDVQRRELLANVSHDLRTPLTLMQGYLETLLLRDSSMSRAEARSCLEVATRHAERLGRLVADLFELAKLDGPADQIAREVFSLSELAQDIAQKFALHAQVRDQRIEARLSGPAPNAAVPVLGDIGLVERALENLVENALRHTPEGGSVGIDVLREGRRARISVCDTGCGIAREDLPHVFDRYFQAPRVENGEPTAAHGRDDGATRHHAGLGLAITRRIVALHGGTIRVDSTPGQGTVFSFDLPLADAGDSHTSDVRSAAPSLPAAPVPGPTAPGAGDRDRSALAQVLTESRRIEQALCLSEQRYALALRGASDGLWEWDIEADRLLGSPRWQHLLGRPGRDGDTLQRADWLALVHPDDRDTVSEALQQHLDGRSDRFEQALRLRHADGRYRWVLSRAAALRHASGKPYRVVGLDTDITRLKRVETLIETIAEGTTARSGEPFFQSLVRHFAQALQIDCAFITECADRPATRARTLAFWRRGGFDANFEYDLTGTPCERVLQQGSACFYPRGVGLLFPREAGKEGYLGLPIFGRDGGVIGHLAFLHGEPLHDEVLVESVYRIFTARAGVEIELAQALRRVPAADAALAA